MMRQCWGLLLLFCTVLVRAENLFPTSFPPQHMQVATAPSMPAALPAQRLPVMPLPAPKGPTQLQVAVWANEAAVAAFQFDYLNHRHFLQTAQQYFSAATWQSFMNDARKLAIKDALSQREVTGAVAEGAPLIQQRSSQQWTVQLPLLVTHMNLHRQSQTHLLVTMQIEPAQPGLRGLTLTSFAAQAR